MKNAQFIKRLVPIFLTTFIAWFYCSAYTPLGYIYNTYPSQDALVMSIATLPGIVAMVGGFAAAALIRIIGRKPLIISSTALMLAGGLLVRFLGDQNIYIAIAGSAMTGFAAGCIPSANISALSEITPSNLSDKIFGINDSFTGLGLMIANALAGVLAANGDWVKAFDIYWIVAAVLVITVIFYPADKKNADAVADGADASSEQAEKIPSSIWGIVVFKFIAALFYMTLSLNISSLIINELQIGTSVHAGTLSSIANFIAMISMAAVFLVLKICKKASIAVTLVITGIAFIVATYMNTIIGVGLCFCIASFGINAQTSGLTTVVGNAVKGKAAGSVAGIFTGCMFVGEALCGYVPAIISNAIFGSAAPSQCVFVAGVACIILGVIGYFVYSKAYILAFPVEKSSK